MTHPLARYLSRHGLSLRAFAQEAETTATTLSRIINYKQSPSMAMMGKISDATNGAVQPNDFRPPAQAAAE